MAKTKKSVSKSKSFVDQLTLAYGATALSVIFATYFFAHVIQLVQDVKFDGTVGSPSTIAGVIALITGLYAALMTKNRRVRYTVVVVLTVLACGFLVWLLGVTGAANYSVN